MEGWGVSFSPFEEVQNEEDETRMKERRRKRRKERRKVASFIIVWRLEHNMVSCIKLSTVHSSYNSSQIIPPSPPHYPTQPFHSPRELVCTKFLLPPLPHHLFFLFGCTKKKNEKEEKREN